MISNESDADARAARYGIPSSGSPLYAATIGVADLDASVSFFRDAMGFDVVEGALLTGAAFERHWRVPPGTRARMSVLADRGCEVGRVALVEFSARERIAVRHVEGQRFFGLVNLNFYTDSIYAQTERLERIGCHAWSRPVVHDMGPVIGQPIEVMLDGPDSLILNLIQLEAPNDDARVLRTRAYVYDAGGFNRCGSTPVVTSQHCVRDYDRAVAFYREALGMSVRNDTVLEGADMETFMRYPPGARSRDTYVQGTHVFGKVAINHPLNFSCDDVVPRAVAPNVGYLAQTFIVADLPTALQRCVDVRADIYSDPVELSLPGLGRVAGAIVRNPGSGALQELLARL